MFDLLKKKISSFTQKIQDTLAQKKNKEEKAPGTKEQEEQAKAPELEEQPLQEISAEKETVLEEAEDKISIEEQVLEEPKKEVFKKPKEPPEEKRKLKASVKVTEKLKSVFTGQIELSESDLRPFLDELELALLEADVEIETARHICAMLEKNLSGQKFSARSDVQQQLKEKVKAALKDAMHVSSLDVLSRIRGKKPFIILFLGPNGAGKTTTIAKVAQFLKNHKLQTIISASDTFRAASIEQLKTHAEKLGVRVVSHSYGSDPTAVAFDTVKAAEAKGIDVVLIDTAGRQETNKNLVAELKKLERVIKPDLKIYIGEAISGQALLAQAKEFDKEIGIDGFVLTKLDADAKGGTAISLLFNLKKPIIFIGTGQKYSDLEEFSADRIIEKIV